MIDFLKDIFQTLFRYLPFPASTGLYRFGKTDTNSPVLLTCNFDLTVRRLSKILKKAGVNCYLLVAPSKGINVWCAACGGHFSAESVISVIKTSGINNMVNHRTLILPQLSAKGVSVKKIREATGWNARFGPVHAKDIPSYIRDNLKKTREMSIVRFPIIERIEMSIAHASLITLFFVVFYLIFWKMFLLYIIPLVWFYCLIMGVLEEWLWGKDLFWKGLIVGVISDVLFLSYSMINLSLPTLVLINWSIILFSLSVFIGFNSRGQSPLLSGAVHAKETLWIVSFSIFILLTTNLAFLSGFGTG